MSDETELPEEYLSAIDEGQMLLERVHENLAGVEKDMIRLKTILPDQVEIGETLFLARMAHSHSRLIGHNGRYGT